MFCDKLIIATGGMAAPKTGSDGSGYELAKALGHTIVILSRTYSLSDVMKS